MNKPLPFFNWSLKKVQESEPDSFVRARIGIIYTIVAFSILKALIVIGFAVAGDQWRQVARAAFACLFYISLVKIVLYRPLMLTPIAHAMIIAGILIVWSNAFIYAHAINFPTIQFIFMVIMSSFFILGSNAGFIYSAISILPAVVLFAFKSNPNIYATNSPQELASPGFEIIIILNFCTIVASHYLFYNAFRVNIREKEALNQELQLSIIEAHQLAASRAAFLSTMSHELRTPLNSVVGITELLLEDNPEERHKDNIKILQFSALDLLSLINNVLDFNKVDSDKTVLETVPFNLSQFIENICSVLRVKANNKQLHLIVDIDPLLSTCNVVSDPTRLSQIMYNIIGNAIKFTESGSVTVAARVTSVLTDRVDVLFSVTDTGTGIHPDKHEMIFELFAQAELNTVRKYGGTGLGLAIVKKVLALFNSAIQLESVPGSGSRFFFNISFTTVATTTPGLLVETGEKTDFGYLRILVVEDNPINRQIIKKQLNTLNIQPIVTENGKEAYDLFMESHFDAIITDLQMPVMDGYETIRRIRTSNDPYKAAVYAIAFTASVTEEEKIMDSGFDDYLYKPVNMNVLQDKLKKIAVYSGKQVLS
jgi:signal transduction histidine kinase/ActR/RegA family two-component response regulator